MVVDDEEEGIVSPSSCVDHRPGWLLTQQQRHAGRDDDEGDEAEAHAGAQHGSGRRFAVSGGIAQAHADVDVGEGAQSRAAGVRHQQGDGVLALLQLHQRVEDGVRGCRGRTQRC